METGANAGDFYFSTDNSASMLNAMVIKSSGNVGIGTTAPDQLLDVRGNIAFGRRAQSAVTRYVGLTRDSNGSFSSTDGIGTAGMILTQAADGDVQLQFKTGEWGVDEAIRMTIANNGSVGIGTTYPQSLLNVQAAAGAEGKLTLSTAELTVVDGDKLGRIDFQAPLESDGTDAILVGASIWAEADDTFAADNNATELVFATGASEAAAEKMRIDSAGNVGIGTAAPDELLHISGVSGNDGATPVTAYLYSRTSSDVWTDNSIFAQVEFGNIDPSGVGDGGVKAKIGAYVDDTTGTDTGLSFYTSSSGTSIQEQMRIDHSGNVGIGTTSPDRLLHAEVSDAVTNAVTYGQRISHITSGTAAAGLGTGIEFEIEGADGTFNVLSAMQGIQTDATTAAEEGELAFLTADIGDDGLAERMRIDKDGNVGIGTTSPEAKLEIAHAADVTNSYITTYSSTDTDRSQLSFRKSAGNTLGTISQTTDGEFLGAINIAGVTTGNVFNNDPVQIQFYQDGDSGASRVPGRIEFKTGDGTNAAATRMTIKGGGSVGIGTASPNSLLEVQAAAGAEGKLTLSTAELTVVDGDKLGRIDFQAPLESDGTDAILVGASIWAEADDTFAADNNATELVFATGASEAAAEKMRIDSAGNVGIANTSPTSKLDVDGGIRADMVTADPCGGADFPEGTIFYNNTSDYYCFCNGAGADMQMHDPATACF